VDGWIDGWVDGWMGGWMGGWMAERMNGWVSDASSKNREGVFEYSYGR